MKFDKSPVVRLITQRLVTEATKPKLLCSRLLPGRWDSTQFDIEPTFIKNNLFPIFQPIFKKECEVSGTRWQQHFMFNATNNDSSCWKCYLCSQIIFHSNYSIYRFPFTSSCWSQSRQLKVMFLAGWKLLFL